MTLAGLILFFGGLACAVFTWMFPVRWKLAQNNLSLSNKEQGIFRTGASMREDMQSLSFHREGIPRARLLLAIHRMSLIAVALGWILLVLDSVLSK